MGKSPGKWIKTLLFGKKSSKSHVSKGKDAARAGIDKDHIVGKGPALAVSSPVISEPILVRTDRSGVIPEADKGATSNFVTERAVISLASQDVGSEGIHGSAASSDLERLKEEQAAVKAQAAFRGYLARRAFRALKGIIRLQALVRGHLVRRQAVATLRSMLALVKLQALVRGHKVRCCGVGLEVYAKLNHTKAAGYKSADAWKENLSSTAYICKLISSSPVVMPLRIAYNDTDPSSVMSWLERWTSSCCWKRVPQPKKLVDLKTQTKRGGFAMETESGRAKRTIRKNSAAVVDNGSSNFTSEAEKPKRSLRKVSSSTVDSLQEHPQTELEKVKRSLRKVSNLAAEASDKGDNEMEKPNRTVRKVSCTQADVPEPNNEDFAEKLKNDIPPAAEMKPESEATPTSMLGVDTENASSNDGPVVESNPLPTGDKQDDLSVPVMNGNISCKDEEEFQENLKTSKRRSSFSTKTEYPENGLQNTPTVPSYMAATESAKAKLRGLSSPRFVTDSVEKNGFTRRHSLPSSTNGKLSSHSPRTQKLVQAGGKGGLRSDKSLLTSRDGNEKPIQVEWRR